MNQGGKYQKSLNNIFNSFDELIYQDVEFAKEVLIESGNNPDEIEMKGLDFIKKLQAKAKIQLFKQKHFDLLETAKAKLSKLVPDMTEAKIKLSEILNRNSPNYVVVNFNSLKELNSEDLFDMMNEAQLLEFLEELENKEK